MTPLPTQGKWRGILTQLGVPGECLTGKHCACPVCAATAGHGGKDRFRFADKDGSGNWHCSRCGHGSGFDLLMKHRGIDFKAARALVAEIVGEVAPHPVKAAADPVKQREAAQRLWNSAHRLKDGDGVEDYLAARGLSTRSPSLRFSPRCRTARGEYHPAMLALVCDAEGSALTVHRTYLAGEGKAKIASPRELMPGKLSDGCAVRLHPPGPVLGVAEGVETALAASALFGVPVWAALNATMLERFQPPVGVQELLIASDSDLSFTGQKAAYTLAHKLAGKVAVSVRIPPVTGDWADIVLAQRNAANGAGR